MAAFAQFGSDLDASTQKLLNRGSKLTELLKQNQYSPLTMAEQVIIIFSGVKGYLDDLETSNIREFENKLVDKIKNENNDILRSIQENGKIDEQTERNLIEVIETIKRN